MEQCAAPTGVARDAGPRAAWEEVVMQRLTWKHAAAALALMAALSLIAPTPAQAAGRGFGEPTAWSGGAWAWIASLWDQIAALVRGGGARTPAGSAPGTESSPGGGTVGIDPDGQSHP
jgi:hypothetical protein